MRLSGGCHFQVPTTIPQDPVMFHLHLVEGHWDVVGGQVGPLWGVQVHKSARIGIRSLGVGWGRGRERLRWLKCQKWCLRSLMLMEMLKGMPSCVHFSHKLKNE